MIKINMLLCYHYFTYLGDVYDALKRGILPHITIHGDFVRAEGKGLNVDRNNSISHGSSNNYCKKRQVGRDVIIDDTCCIIRIQTNRKATWQKSYQVSKD